MDNEKHDQGGVSEKSLKLMGRIDKVELNEVKEEVYVKDDFGVYIIYDCVLQDMKCMEEELIKIERGEHAHLECLVSKSNKLRFLIAQ